MRMTTAIVATPQTIKIRLLPRGRMDGECTKTRVLSVPASGLVHGAVTRRCRILLVMVPTGAA